MVGAGYIKGDGGASDLGEEAPPGGSGGGPDSGRSLARPRSGEAARAVAGWAFGPVRSAGKLFFKQFCRNLNKS